jgi:hypothetical protein
MKPRIRLLAFVVAFVCLHAALARTASAQNRGAAPTSAKAAAPADLTGYWVAYVTEDWRFRMLTPPKGDYQNVPLTPEGRQVADVWNPSADDAAGNQCKAYGAAAIMRIPARVHVTWQDDNTLRMDVDAGTQTRTFQFGAAPKPAQPTWQGSSSATWETAAKSLKVVTTKMRPGYLRRNGVPYSENAVLTEYFELVSMPNGGQVLLVTAIVDDPRYLQTPFIVSSQFKKEVDGSKWDPTPCSTTW